MSNYVALPGSGPGHQPAAEDHPSHQTTAPIGVIIKAMVMTSVLATCIIGMAFSMSMKPPPFTQMLSGSHAKSPHMRLVADMPPPLTFNGVSENMTLIYTVEDSKQLTKEAFLSTYAYTFKTGPPLLPRPTTPTFTDAVGNVIDVPGPTSNFPVSMGIAVALSQGAHPPAPVEAFACHVGCVGSQAGAAAACSPPSLLTGVGQVICGGTLLTIAGACENCCGAVFPPVHLAYGSFCHLATILAAKAERERNDLCNNGVGQCLK